MRVDVNISIRKHENDPLGTRVEVKNMNSFSAIKRAIEHEYARQVKLYQEGIVFDQETRGRDDAKGESYPMRSKEEALDYRYFPEPDLPPLYINQDTMKRLQEQPIIIPHDIIKTMKEKYGFHKEYINALIAEKEILNYFMEFITNFEPKLVAKWIS